MLTPYAGKPADRSAASQSAAARRVPKLIVRPGKLRGQLHMNAALRNAFHGYDNVMLLTDPAGGTFGLGRTRRDAGEPGVFPLRIESAGNKQARITVGVSFVDDMQLEPGQYPMVKRTIPGIGTVLVGERGIYS